MPSRTGQCMLVKAGLSWEPIPGARRSREGYHKGWISDGDSVSQASHYWRREREKTWLILLTRFCSAEPRGQAVKMSEIAESVAEKTELK